MVLCKQLSMLTQRASLDILQLPRSEMESSAFSQIVTGLPPICLLIGFWVVTVNYILDRFACLSTLDSYYLKFGPILLSMGCLIRDLLIAA